MGTNLTKGPSKRVVVSIVNWNGGKLLPSCLESLDRQTFRDFEIYIFDNASSDGSLQWILEERPDIDVITHDKNAGFSFGHNEIIRMTKSDYVMPLNFDIILENDFIERLVSFADTHLGVGMFSGKLIKMADDVKTRRIDSTGIIMPCAMQAARGENEEDVGQFDNKLFRHIFGPCGAAPLYRRSMLDDIAHNEEYFDEDFCIYVEDVDLAWRAQLRGWRGYYCWEAVGYHKRGATREDSSKLLYDYLVMGFGNRYCSMIKNLTRYQLLTYFRAIALFELKFLLLKHPYPYSVNIRSFLHCLRKLPKMLAKRRIVQGRIRCDINELDRFFNFEKHQ